MRNSAGDIVNQVTDEDGVLVNFDVSETGHSSAEIAAHELPEFPIPYNITYPMTFFCEKKCFIDNTCGENDYQCKQTCKDNCSGDHFENYNECMSSCDSTLLDNYASIADDPDPAITKCKNFCSFAITEAYTCMRYFHYSNLLYDSENACDPLDENKFINDFYNNGTSNVFLAASLGTTQENGEYIYKVKFENTPETGGNSHQLYEINSGDERKSKSIWMSESERSTFGFNGIYPRGYFYACQEDTGPGTTCDKKLFIPYGFGSWKFAEFLWNNIKADNLSGNPYTDTQVNNLHGQNLFNEVEYQTKKFGLGIYDFEEECRVKYSTGDNNVSCSENSSSDNDYPNINILWSSISKMSNTTVIHGPDLDPLSTKSDFDRYIYFMGTGEAVIEEISGLTWANLSERAIKTQKAYVARVPAYDSEIKNASSYEYFAGISNEISRWSDNIDNAKPLYSFYPMESMGAESVIRHKGLYWMTAPLNETEEKGVVVLASPDMFNWQKMDTILFEKPDSIYSDYAFFWLPPSLIHENDNTMPFLYSIWKSNHDPNEIDYVDSNGIPQKYQKMDFHLKGFLDEDLDPKFTHYNLKTGKYNFMRDNKTGVFLVNNSVYGNLLQNNIPGTNRFNRIFNDNNINIPKLNVNDGNVFLPFKGFQNLEYLGISGQEAEILKPRYVLVQYCDCGDQDENRCKNFIYGNCSPFNVFLDEYGKGGGNWKTIEISDSPGLYTRVNACSRKVSDNDPDYMCDIIFEHSESENLKTGTKSTPVWKWRHQIAVDKDEDINDIVTANVILRFSHWYDIEFISDFFPDINTQLLENNKVLPYDCEEYLDEEDGDVSEMKETCRQADSWKTTNLIHLEYIDPNPPDDPGPIDPDSVRIEYLYPSPFLVPGFDGPGDPPCGNIFVADHFTGNFYETGSVEYGVDVVGTLSPGFAITAAISESSMNVFAWGGKSSSMVLLNSSSSQIAPERILFSGSYNPETKSVVLNQSSLTETAGSNSPSMTEGASMVYDDVNGKIYLIGAVDKTGVSRIYRLDTSPQTASIKSWTPITQIDTGKYFRLVKKSSREYFVVGGIKTDGSFSTKVFLLNLDDVSSPQLLTNIPSSGLANSFSAYNEKNGKLYIYGGIDSGGTSDRFLSFDTKTLSWTEINSTSGPGAASGGVLLVNYVDETISLGGGRFENPEDSLFTWVFDEESTSWTKKSKDLKLSYCLNETDFVVKGGLKVSGECLPFTHPWYRSFSAGATVYSVAGNGDRLYVGTNGHIKVYDISDPAAMTYLSDYSTNGERVYDLEVTEDNEMYAATSGGIYRLDISDPDTITLINNLYTGFFNYQYRIQLYNDLLYVGDDNGINIRDKETFVLISYVNTGAVLDFAISDGEISMYRSTFFSSMIQIRDVDSLNMKAWEYANCYTGELTADHGEFYLSCDGYKYRFEGRTDTYIDFYSLEADMLEMQENHVNNGWVYFPSGSSIKLSTLNDVPSLCGNGIVEPGELCDGNSVACTSIDPDYYGGTAYCNSTCDGYNENNCEEDDGW